MEESGDSFPPDSISDEKAKSLGLTIHKKINGEIWMWHASNLNCGICLGRTENDVLRFACRVVAV